MAAEIASTARKSMSVLRHASEPDVLKPHYLHRFVVERAVSIDTTSAGGNATPLSLDEDGI